MGNENSVKKIGFVGVGRMGANMARCLKGKGFSIVSVYDSDLEKAEKLAKELACEACTTPAQVAKQSEVVFTVVTDDQSMNTLFDQTNDEGLLHFAEDRLFINCATVSPHIHEMVEHKVEAEKGFSLEACMASSIPQAREGTLYFMCGGKREVFERAKPILEALGLSLRYMGKAGEAAKVKALVNMVMNINTAGLAEGLGLGEALGFDVTMLREVFAQTGAASRVLETDGLDMQGRDHECYFSAAHAAKDLGIAVALTEQEGLHSPLATAALEQYRRLVASGKGELDKSGVAELTFRGRS